MTDLSIAILCGGEASRFGSDKTRVRINEVPLYRLIWNKLEDKSDDVFLQIDPGDEYNLPTRPDLISGKGPLGAIYSALAHAAHEWLFVSACDLPYLDPRIVTELCSEVEEGTEVVIPRWDNGYLEPLAALYNTSVLNSLEKNLESGIRKITDFFDCLDNVKGIAVDQLIEEGRISSRCFYNINTKKDFKKLDL